MIETSQMSDNYSQNYLLNCIWNYVFKPQPHYTCVLIFLYRSSINILVVLFSSYVWKMSKIVLTKVSFFILSKTGPFGGGECRAHGIKCYVYCWRQAKEKNTTTWERGGDRGEREDKRGKKMKSSTRISAGKCFTGGQIVIKNAKVPAGSTTAAVMISTICIHLPHSHLYT